jgi:cell division protease FtsH
MADMTPYRRYGRWMKRAAFFFVLYLVIAYLLLGITPGQAITNPGPTLTQYRSLIVQILFVMSFMVIQFVALFWFLSRGSSYTLYPGEYDVTFDDVRGQPAAVASTKEVLRLFQGFKDFKQMGGYPPHGILFEGPPGTGKTLMAKAVAGAASVPFLYGSGSGFSNMFMGVPQMKMRRLFKKARTMSDKYGGAVIFIDEIDAIGGSRGAVTERMSPDGTVQPPNRVIMGGMGMGGGMGVINELLVQMDGLIVPRGLWRHIRRIVFQAKPKVPFYNILIIGATNRAATLDPALLRPGRFDRKIHVGLPDHEGREDIGTYYLAKVRHEPIDHRKFARMTVQYSPAMIKNVVNEALIFALQDGRDALRWDDLWQAKLVEEVGLKQPVKYVESEKVATATHEAAHAVVSYTLQRGDRQIQVITIQKREGALGLVHGQPVDDFYSMTQRQALAQIRVSVAGLISEQMWFGFGSSGGSSDLQHATYLAARIVGFWGLGSSLISEAVAAESEASAIRKILGTKESRDEVDEILNDARRHVRALLAEKKHVVEGVRDALLEREELIGDEIEALMAELGEREPFDWPYTILTGDGHGNGQGNGQLALGEGEEEGDEEPAPQPAGPAEQDGSPPVTPD